MTPAVGDQARYLGCDDFQARWGNLDDPRAHLLAGRIYEVIAVEEHSWHTSVSLRGHQGKFNSVCFQFQNPRDCRSTRIATQREPHDYRPSDDSDRLPMADLERYVHGFWIAVNAMKYLARQAHIHPDELRQVIRECESKVGHGLG